MTDRAKNSPSVTKFTDMNEYRNASNFDHPLTRPVALRRNSPGASLTAAIDRTPSSCPNPRSGRPDESSAVDQLVVLHLVLLRIDRDDRRLEDAFLVRAAGVQRQRPPEPGGAAALMDVAVERQERLEAGDRVAYRSRADR